MAAVPVPEVVPPADSIVRLIELSMVPVTVSVPDDVAACVADVAKVMHVPTTTANLLRFMIFEKLKGLKNDSKISFCV